MSRQLTPLKLGSWLTLHGVQSQNLILDAGDILLPFMHDEWLIGAFPISWNREGDVAIIASHVLTRVPVTTIADGSLRASLDIVLGEPLVLNVSSG